MSSESVVRENNIHVGFWTNWSHGRIAGATYTVTNRDGYFLIAFLASFITFVGTCFWRIISFIAHQYFSREDAQDAIYVSPTSSYFPQLKLKWRRSLSATSLAVGLACYGINTFTKDCTAYTRQSLPFNITRGTACPFSGQDIICRNVSGNIRIDTGFINSHFDLGINAPPENRFLLRLVTECAPLLNDGYTQVQNSTATTPVIDVLYGPSYQFGKVTYQYPNAAPIPVEGKGYGIRDYVLGQLSYSPTDPINYSNDQWIPIPELIVTDGVVTVLFLSSNDVSFINKTTDPWYSAQTFRGFSPDDGVTPHYAHDDVVRALGCIEKLQLCNPNLPANSSCTPLTGSSQAFQLGFQLWQDPTQQAYFNWSTFFIGNVISPSIPTIVNTIGPGVLQSRSTLFLGRQPFIPDNQWELDMENFFKVMLASLQRLVVDQATGPADPALLPTVAQPNITEQQKADSYTSINLLGLIVIFVVGGLIIVTSFALPIVVRRIQQRQNSHSSLEWIVNDTLQLQRLAHEAVGAGIWQGTDGNFPTTAQCELLAELDVTNPTYPKLHCTHHDNMVNDNVMKAVVDEGCQEPLILIFPNKAQQGDE
ncbi:hypothetical protein V8E54_008451 [Elaphomyces granulatus]